MHLARTLSIVIALTDVNPTLVWLTARRVTFTRHAAWETVVAERTHVTTPASIAFSTGTLTADDVTLTGQ